MLLDVLLHRNRATDWAGKNVVSEDSAIHHIFPREFLKEKGETRDEHINCIGNLTFVDPGINSEIGDTPPQEYLRDYTGIFAAHMIPDDPKLWRFDDYERFLGIRLRAMWRGVSAMLAELNG